MMRDAGMHLELPAKERGRAKAKGSRMAEWVETYRGVVSAWECDIVEHFTIAYYFDRFADATRNLLELIGEGMTVGPAVGTLPARLYTTFLQELRAGAGFHILSAVTAVEEKSLRLGHRVVDSTSAQTVGWLAETLTLPAAVAPQARRQLEAQTSPWPGPEVPPPVARPRSVAAPLTARNRVKPWEIDENGTMSLAAVIHRFSGAGMQFLSSVGMTGAYMHENRRGFSTLALDLRVAASAKAGERIDVRTSISHLGNTSLSYVHHMSATDDREIASLEQVGVHLDLDARRPTAVPAAIRESITKLLSKA
jgi:acyl-CoA thioesterase FadM